MTVDFSFDDEPTVNSQDELAVDTFGRAGAEPGFKLCGP